MAAEADKKPRERVYVKNKNESVGNIAAFYGLGCVAQAILNEKVVASHITHKSRTKAVAKYDYNGGKPSKDDQSNIASLLNQMISKGAQIKSTKLNETPPIDTIPENIDHNSKELYQISIQDSIKKADYIGISHVQLPDNLGMI